MHKKPPDAAERCWPFGATFVAPVTLSGGVHVSGTFCAAQQRGMGLHWRPRAGICFVRCTKGHIRSASASVRESVAQLSTVENDLMRQLAEAMGRYRTAQRTVQIYEQGILPDARKTLELVQALYSAGQVDLLKILQTQRSVVEANLDYIIALQSRFSEAATIAGLLQLDEFP